MYRVVDAIVAVEIVVLEWRRRGSLDWDVVGGDSIALLGSVNLSFWIVINTVDHENGFDLGRYHPVNQWMHHIQSTEEHCW